MKIIRFSQKGLVGYWRFDEETGSTAKDSSPYGNDGTIYGATRVRGIIGKALSFDGVDDYVEVPDSESLDITDEITIEVWVKPAIDLTSDLTTSSWFVYKYQTYYLYYHQNGFLSFYTAGTSPSETTFPTTFNANTWYHIVGTFDSNTGTKKLFINGENVKTETGITGTISTTDYNVYISGAYHNRPFNGTIDEVRIYNRALSPGEIRIHYAFFKYIKPHPIIMRRKL